MKTFYRIFLLTVVLATSISSQAAPAGWKNESSYSFLASNQTNKITEQAAVTIAKKHIGGRVLAVGHTNNAYRIKILSDKGTVHIISVNSDDGSIAATH